MPEAFQGNYHSISDMRQEEMAGGKTVPGKKFYVHLAGKTNNAHQSVVDQFMSVGQHQVSSPEESHYLLVFCPSVSRVGTDISDALDNMPGGKPAILVVMHHTFNTSHVVAPSSRQVNNTRVILTVDTLFYEHEFLKADRNDIAWYDIQKCLGLSPSQVTTWQGKFSIWCGKNWRWVASGLLGIAVIVVIAFVIGKYGYKQ